MLQRLQDQKSSFDVYKWETERKEEIQRIKNICLYKPSLIGKPKKMRVRRRTAQPQGDEGANRHLYNMIKEASQNDMGENS